MLRENKYANSANNARSANQIIFKNLGTRNEKFKD